MYYGSEEEFFSQYGSYYSSVDDVVQQGIDNEMQGVYQYLPEEMVVSAVYSKAELMKQAGMNTLLGMGTVFVVLIFISFIISLFKFLPALFAKKPKIEDLKKEESKPAAPAKAATPAPAAGNLMNDAELIFCPWKYRIYCVTKSRQIIMTSYENIRNTTIFQV